MDFDRTAVAVEDMNAGSSSAPIAGVTAALASVLLQKLVKIREPVPNGSTYFNEAWWATLAAPTL